MPPSTHAVVVDIIKKGRGTHLDPDMVDAFLEIHEPFRNIARDLPIPRRNWKLWRKIHPRSNSSDPR